MTDINRQIEGKAREYAERVLRVIGNNQLISLDRVANDYAQGYKDALNYSRWRKVSEDEFPEIDTPILCKFRVGSMQPSIQYRVSILLKSGRFSGETDWVSVVEWKPID